MKKIIVAVALLLSPCLALGAPPTKNQMSEVENRIAIRNLVDEVALLADEKDIRKQLELFTEDVRVEAYVNGNAVTKLAGKKAVGDAFDGFLKSFETVYHFNGQQIVSIAGDRATGTLYCMNYLFGKENGKRMKTTFGVRYEDEYLFENGKWRISKRTSYYQWQDKQEAPQ